jgi:outer membrane protein assembly factor BamB
MKGVAVTVGACLLLVSGCDRWRTESACDDEKLWSVATTAQSVGLTAGEGGLLASLDAVDEIRLGDAGFGAGQHGVVLLDAADGSVRWRNEFPADGLWHGAVWSPGGLMFAGEVRFGGASDRLIVRRLDPADGTELWSVELAGERDGAGILPMAARDDRVAVSTSTEVVMLDAADGSVLWQQPVVADRLALTAGGEVVSAQVYGSEVRLLASADGSTVWTHDADPGVNALAATSDGGVTIAVGFAPYVIRRLAADGALRWERELPGRWYASLVALPGDDLLWMSGLEDRVDTVAGMTIEDGCGYITRLAAADGATSNIRVMCDCAIDGVATADPGGRAFLATPDIAGDGGSVAAFP